MIEVSAAREAEQVCARVKPLLESFGHIDEVTIQPYWKIAEYYEIIVHISPRGDLESAFDRIVAYAVDGWRHGPPGPERWSVWNAETDTVFLAPEVRWANIEVLPPST